MMLLSCDSCRPSLHTLYGIDRPTGPRKFEFGRLFLISWGTLLCIAPCFRLSFPIASSSHCQLCKLTK